MAAGRWVAGATVAASIAVAVVWRHRPVVAVALVGFTVALGWLSAVDLREHRLPNRVVGPMALAAVAWVVGYAVADGNGHRAVVALAAGLVGSVGLLVLRLVGTVGMGDVKLAFPVGVVAGWLGGTAIQVTVLVTALAGAVVSVGVLVAARRRGTRVPYGPFLAAGSVAGMLLAARS